MMEATDRLADSGFWLDWSLKSRIGKYNHSVSGRSLWTQLSWVSHAVNAVVITLQKEDEEVIVIS